MVKEIKVKCPAKINLTLEVLNKREDGFHNIQSVMQTISLFDILTIKLEESEVFEIKLSGTSDEIPYDEKNLVYKAAKLFFNSLFTSLTRSTAPTGSLTSSQLSGSLCHISPFTVSIYIKKNIPIAAGLAGGSTDAAGTLWGLNELFDNLLSQNELHKLCAQLGSDLNFCLEGGCQLATSRGEILQKLPFQEFDLSLIKPRNLGISAKEAYTKFSQLKNKPNLDMTTKLVAELNGGHANIEKYLHNDLEIALIRDYAELKTIKENVSSSLMSGSGSTFFALKKNIAQIDNSYWLENDLKSIPFGVSEQP